MRTAPNTGSPAATFGRKADLREPQGCVIACDASRRCVKKRDRGPDEPRSDRGNSQAKPRSVALLQARGVLLKVVGGGYLTLFVDLLRNDPLL
jgi:hypothetical protein